MPYGKRRHDATGPGGRNASAVVSRPFRSRRRAREVERAAQAYLNALTDTAAADQAGGDNKFDVIAVLPGKGHYRLRVPVWTRGVRVERAGLFQFVIVATQHKGH